MSYKPPNWENPYTKEEWHTDVEWAREDVAIGFEAGADKMFEGLSKLSLEELMKIFAKHTDRYEELE